MNSIWEELMVFTQPLHNVGLEAAVLLCARLRTTFVSGMFGCSLSLCLAAVFRCDAILRNGMG